MSFDQQETTHGPRYSNDQASAEERQEGKEIDPSRGWRENECHGGRRRLLGDGD